SSFNLHVCLRKKLNGPFVVTFSIALSPGDREQGAKNKYRRENSIVFYCHIAADHRQVASHYGPGILRGIFGVIPSALERAVTHSRRNRAR
ncbi:MAG TPA: hypothetical protein VGH22_24740, partial [Candidatus Binatia bacterium]